MVVSTRPCEVLTKPEMVQARAEVTLTGPETVPSAAVLRFSSILGVGAAVRVLVSRAPVVVEAPGSV